MARGKGVRVTVLGEDKRQVSFARRVLMLLGFSRHEIINRAVPDGDGSGAQWVSQDYPGQVASQRRRGQHQQVTLVVSIDADNTSVAIREQQLDKELVKAGEPTRGDSEPIVVWVPDRNIETWFWYFAGNTVEDGKDYKNKVKKPDYRQASEAFVAEFRKYRLDPSSVTTLPSLRAAYEELSRIL